MSGRLVEFPLEDGGSILVEVTEASDGRLTRGLNRDGLAEQTQQTFEQAISRVQPAANALLGRLRAMADAAGRGHRRVRPAAQRGGRCVHRVGEHRRDLHGVLTWRRVRTRRAAGG